MKITKTNMTDYQKFIHTSRYARWIDSEGRRETWEETVERYCDWMANHIGNDKIPASLWGEIEHAILRLEVMPSMRCMMTAGPALDRTHVAGYNCAYMPVDNLRSFDECAYILMCGTGVGFSVEDKYVKQLPEVGSLVEGDQPLVIVPDSKEGWAISLRHVIDYLFAGYQPRWDTSRVRPAGARLRTFGGRASGPGPLEELFTYVSEVCAKARGRQLTSLECHDIMCKIAEVVVVGGVRRSAMISLSDLNDEGARYAKHGSWWTTEPQRGLSNNSAVYLGRPSVGEFLREWQSLYDSKSGERGIFNRQASITQARRNGRRGLQEIIVTDENGGTVKLGPNDNVRTQRGVVPATELQVGDTIQEWDP
jgi:ribonucleoside-triphosphate reductase (thioredoxin)